MTTRIIVDVFYRDYSLVDSICADEMIDSVRMGKREEFTALDLAEIPYTNAYTFDFPLEEGEIDIREYTFTLMNGMNIDHQPPQGLRSMMVGDYLVIETQTDFANVWSMELCASVGWRTIGRGNTPVPVEYPGDPS
jgi:hypothetical protein